MTMTTDKDRLLAFQLEARGFGLVLPSDARTLRLASMTLHRWAELECGDGNEYASWAIERDETTNVPYMMRYSYRTSGPDTVTRRKVPDREAGALKRVAALCAERGWYFFHQTDPRGAALYVSTEPLTDSNYTNGVAV